MQYYNDQAAAPPGAVLQRIRALDPGVKHGCLHEFCEEQEWRCVLANFLTVC